jgi:c-di-GMP-binding flagellar brake protein YcgR
LPIPAYAITGAVPREEWWRWVWIPEPSPTSVSIALIIVVAAVGLLVLYDIRAARRHKAAIRRRNWELFGSITSMHALTPSEVEFLKRFARYQPEENPVAIVNSPAEYDACVEHELSSLSKRRATESEIDDTLNLVSSIRRKLALDNLPQGQFLHSTRGLLPNQEIKLRALGTKVEEQEFDSTVVAVTERELTITAPRLKGEIYHVDPGGEVEINMVRKNDAIYLFNTRVLRTFVGRAPLVTVAHTNDLHRIQLRRYYRVDVEVPLSFAVLDRREINQSEDESDGVITAALLGARETGHGVLRNISGGGALVEGQLVLARGDFLNFDLDLWNGQKENITGEVVDIIFPPSPAQESAENRRRKTAVHLTFVGMNDKVRDKIVKYVFRRQLDDIRKSREQPDPREQESFTP